MPIYPFHCPSCGRDEDHFARVEDRDANPPSCCGAAMQRQLTAPLVSVPGDVGYQCPMTGETVTTHRRRKYLMEKNGVVDARDYTTSWKRVNEQRAAEKAQVEKELASIPEAVKKAALAPPP